MIRMPEAAAALLASLLIATPAAAQTPPTAGVREVLHALPMPPSDGPPPVVGYLALPALLAGGATLPDALRTSTPPEMLQMPLAAEARTPGSFADRAGFAPDRIEQVGFFEGAGLGGPDPAALRLKDA